MIAWRIGISALALATAACGAAPNRSPVNLAESSSQPRAVSPETTVASGQQATVSRVIDGDTLDLRATQAGTPIPSTALVRVRILNADTPETVNPKTGVECYGPEASAATKKLLPAGTVVSVAAERELRDRYGRYLLHVRTADGTLVSEWLIRRGYATVMLIPPNTSLATRMRAAQSAAVKDKAGLWGPPCNTKPPASPSSPSPTEVFYRNCDAARAAGKAPLYAGQPGYRPDLDGNHNGVACE